MLQGALPQLMAMANSGTEAFFANRSALRARPLRAGVCGKSQQLIEVKAEIELLEKVVGPVWSFA